MNREILFRGKSTIDGNWVYGFLNYAEQEKKYYIGVMELMTPVITETVGQFTGLTDKNGVKIFEGDIVKYYQPYSKKTDVHIVSWDHLLSCFALFEDGNKWAKESDWIKIQHIEITVNIHDKK